MKLFDLYNNSHVATIVSHDVINNMINHSYMLVSSDTYLVREYAKYVASAFLCKSNEAPCGNCNVCKRIEHGNYSDVIVYPKDNKSIMTEDINSIVLDEAVLPFESDKKVYILYDFDKATVQAQNKLLKTLEEPNKSTIFILTASNINNVLPTIRSRSKKIEVGVLDDGVIKDYLISDGVDAFTAELVASHSFGNLTYALSHTKNISGKEIIVLAKDIFNNLKDSSMVLEYSNKCLKYKDNLEDLVSQMMICVQDIARICATNGESSEYNVGLYNLKSLEAISSLCEEAIKKNNANCNPNSIIDGLLLGILEARYKCSKQQV